MRPVIGVTTNPRVLTVAAGHDRAHTTLMTYVDMVRAAGGLPVVLPTGAVGDIPQMLDLVDGVVFTGGGDIDPDRYGGTLHPRTYGILPDRDEFDLALATAVAERRSPTLAICRGMQVMNVSRGGTLIEDVVDESPEHLDHYVIGDQVRVKQHEVTLEVGSRVAKAAGRDHLEVNSVHHQAVRDLGDGLIATGWAPDGIIEALEWHDDSWLLWAIQWHPEWLGPDDAPSLSLFETLVGAAG